MSKLLMFAALAGGLALASQAFADDHAQGVRVGTLSCHEASGWGFVFGSSHDVRCTFTSGDRIEHYRGNISKFGVDIGYQQSGVLLWEVFAPNNHADPGVLAAVVRARFGPQRMKDSAYSAVSRVMDTA